MKETDENIENQFGIPKKEHPFRVPDGYFETFADRLKARIEEDEQPNKKRSLFIYIKPALMMAASFILVMLLVSVPIKKFFPGNGYFSQQQLNIDSVDSVGVVPAAIFSYFSEEQLLSAVTDMNEFEADTISTDNLGDFIASNYSDYELIANN